MIDEPLVIAQISDTHIGSATEARPGDNLARLDRVLDRLAGMARRPDLLIATGDLADASDGSGYRLLRERFDRLPFPAHVAIGNHDDRAAACAVFGGGEADFLHYTLEAGPLRVIVLDTLEEGRHGGAFCEARAAWLRDRLTEAPDRPTLIALHHPPIDTGIDWLTTSPAEPWVARLDMALAGHHQLVGMIAGHVHRTIEACRNGLPVRVCPSIAPPLALDLAPLDPHAPDGRVLVTDGPPGYALHLWQGGVLTSHVDFVTGETALARYDARMQPHVAAMFAERP